MQSAYALTDRLAVVLNDNSSYKGDPYGKSGGAYFTGFTEVNKWGTFLGTSIGVAKELPDCYDVQCNWIFSELAYGFVENNVMVC